MNSFDIKSKTWDENPMRIELAAAIASQIKNHLPENASKIVQALDFGCGTGNLSFNLYQHLNKITLIDTSLGMIDVLKSKISNFRISNMFPYHLELNHETTFSEQFYTIYSMMTLHHIKNTEDCINLLDKHLQKNGILCLADLYTEDGTFHLENEDVHYGFEPDFIEHILLKKNYTIIETTKVYTITRTNKNGVLQSFPVFLIVAKKNN